MIRFFRALKSRFFNRAQSSPSLPSSTNQATNSSVSINAPQATLLSWDDFTNSVRSSFIGVGTSSPNNTFYVRANPNETFEIHGTLQYGQENNLIPPDTIIGSVSSWNMESVVPKKEDDRELDKQNKLRKIFGDENA